MMFREKPEIASHRPSVYGASCRRRQRLLDSWPGSVWVLAHSPSIADVKRRWCSTRLTPRKSCRAADARATVWVMTAGSASPYTIRWPRPANVMRVLGGAETSVAPLHALPLRRKYLLCLSSECPWGLVQGVSTNWGYRWH